MTAVTLRTRRLLLDQPTASDRDAIVEYCQDSLFEHYMTLPWPYEPKHADFFIDHVVPQGWASGSELTWSIRQAPGAPLLGMIGWRAAGNDIGYWLGAPHRRSGYMTEALSAVLDYLFETLGLESVTWECVVGNEASAAVARATGFRYTGEGPTALTFRDGSHPLAWHAVLSRDDWQGRGDREGKVSWPSTS